MASTRIPYALHLPQVIRNITPLKEYSLQKLGTINRVKKLDWHWKKTSYSKKNYIEKLTRKKFFILLTLVIL